MGGHGGLNILPQKKWNVYNMENRNIVEKDKRLDKERKQKQQQQEHKEQAKNRIQQLKKKKYQTSQTPSSRSSRNSRSRSESKKDQQQSKINQELKQIQEQKKHINLFEEEEQQLTKQQNIKAKIELEKEFFKDKPYDISTKFLGSYDQNKPWYTQIKENEFQQNQHSYVRQQLQKFKDSEQYYQVLDISKKYQENTPISNIGIKKEEEQQIKQENNQEQQFKENDKEKYKQLQKLGKELKELLGSDDSEASEYERKKLKKKQFQKEQMRRERIQREKVERFKEQKLMATKYEFKQN